MTVVQEIPKVAGILEVAEEALLQEMTSRFIKGKIADSEQGVGKFYLPRQALERENRCLIDVVLMI
jgi:hypothetical protein